MAIESPFKKAHEPFRIDLESIRNRARDKMSSGAITGAYHADLQEVVKVLNEALATEIVCTLRYKNHYYMADGIAATSVAAEFAEHAEQEQEHADWIAERITQLGGTPNYNPEGLLSRSHSEYKEGNSLESMLREDLVAERIAIETYSEIVRWLGEDDPTTRRLMERILAVEEEHADDLASLLKGLNGNK
jgi:bacterioferritin